MPLWWESSPLREAVVALEGSPRRGDGQIDAVGWFNTGFLAFKKTRLDSLRGLEFLPLDNLYFIGQAWCWLQVLSAKRLRGMGAMKGLQVTLDSLSILSL